MKLRSVFTLTVLLTLSNGLWAQNFSSITDALNTFATKSAPALPAMSSIGSDWSDAWVGDLLGVPPHFGIGLTTGFTTIPVDGMQALFGAFGTSVPSLINQIGVPLPVYNVNGRIGGFFLPFDIGFKVGYLPTVPVGVDLNYLTVGGDFRYALLKDGVTPGISVGVGVNYLKTQLGYTFSQFSQTYTIGGQSVPITAPKASLSLENISYELKAEISKNLIILTPYLGAAVNLSSSTVTNQFDAANNLSAGQLAAVNAALSGTNFSNSGFTNTVTINNAFGYRIFGGASFNLTLIKIDVQAFYTGTLGIDLGARLQL